MLFMVLCRNLEWKWTHADISWFFGTLNLFRGLLFKGIFFQTVGGLGWWISQKSNIHFCAHPHSLHLPACDSSSWPIVVRMFRWVFVGAETHNEDRGVTVVYSHIVVHFLLLLFLQLIPNFQYVEESKHKHNKVQVIHLDQAGDSNDFVNFVHCYLKVRSEGLSRLRGEVAHWHEHPSPPPSICGH